MTIPVDGRKVSAGFYQGAACNAWRWLMALCVLPALALPAVSQSQSGQSTLGPAFKNPENIWFDGSGNVKLTASKNKVEWQGNLVETNVYSAEYKTKPYRASYTPPTIRVNPKTILSLNLDSRINYTGADPCDHEYTNLHYHGYEVSPLEPQDDIYIRVENNNPANNPYKYRVVLPPDHPEGMFWYHPHPHGCSFWQVNSGLSGVLIVGDILKKRYPHWERIKEQILLIKDGDPRPRGTQEEENRVLNFAATAAPGNCPQRDPSPVTVNAMKEPNITINTGEYQFFRIGNVGSDTFVKVAFDGPRPVVAGIIAVDGMATPRLLLLPPEGWLLPPGSRVEMVVQGPRDPGVYKLVSRAIPCAVAPAPNSTMATLDVRRGTVSKAAGPSLAALAQGAKVNVPYYPKIEDFAEPSSPDACVIHSKPPEGDKYKGCDFVFSQAFPKFLINGKTYEENRTDVTCQIGKEIEWTLCNDSPQHHAFHIHQIHFDVLSINGQPVEAPIRDVVDMPEQPDASSVSKTKTKMNFKYDYLAGRFVLHCHMLFHEDKGMMMNIEMKK